MEVALAIALAAFVGGVIFMLLDNWQRKHPAAAAVATEPAPVEAPIWTPSPAGGWAPPTYERPEPPRPTWAPPASETRTDAFERPAWQSAPEPPAPPRPAWPPASEERTEPLPPSRWQPASERSEPPPPRPLWTPPASTGQSRWDDDDRHRGHDDEDDPPPGLWSGWARR